MPVATGRHAGSRGILTKGVESTYSGKLYILQGDGHGFQLNVDPPTNPGTFTGTATVTFTALIVGTQTITTPIEGGWWAPDHDHTAFVIDWTKSESPFAAFYPYTKRARYNGFASMIKTNPGDPTGSMWSGVMLDLNNKVSQTTWVTDGPFQEG